MKAGKADPMQRFAEGTTRDIVAEKLNIRSGETYRKEKFICDNRSVLTQEDFDDWDEGKLLSNPVKLGRCIKELDRIYEIQNGATSFQGNQYDMVSPKVSESPAQEQLANMIGISVDTLNNYKKLTELVPEL